MNFRVIFQIFGRVSVLVGVLMCLPMILSACLGESCWWAFAIAIAIAVAVGVPVVVLCKPKSKAFFSKEGLVLVSLSWIWVSLVGALPFVISGAIPSYIDAFFETVSGFTTTGATILQGSYIEQMAKGLLFWRSFTHWIGGMGVIVFVMMIASNLENHSIHVLRAEMPGPTVDKLVPRARTTVKILYLLYIGLTLLEITLLIFGGMPIFDSVVHSFGTAGTGGFGIKADSIAGYNAFCQWVIAIFMMLFGVNFNLYYLMILCKFRQAFSSRELWIYAGVIVFSATVVTFNVISQLPYTKTTADAVRFAVFHVASFLTTTGYTAIPASSSINAWPLLSKSLLFCLMFIGGCAGSTAGGLKVSRVAILGCSVRKELRKILHPRNANSVKFEGKVLSKEVLQSATNYFGIYMLVLISTFLILSFDGCPDLTIEANLTAAASCLNNIGPAYGTVASGYYMYSPLSKIVLSVAMLLGRLEIYPLLLTLSPKTWIRRRL